MVVALPSRPRVASSRTLHGWSTDRKDFSSEAAVVGNIAQDVLLSSTAQLGPIGYGLQRLCRTSCELGRKVEEGGIGLD